MEYEAKTLNLVPVNNSDLKVYIYNQESIMKSGFSLWTPDII